MGYILGLYWGYIMYGAGLLGVLGPTGLQCLVCVLQIASGSSPRCGSGEALEWPSLI